MQFVYNGELSSTLLVCLRTPSPPAAVRYFSIVCLPWSLILPFFPLPIFSPSLSFSDMNLLQKCTHPSVTLLLAFFLCQPPSPSRLSPILRSLPTLPPTITPLPSPRRRCFLQSCPWRIGESSACFRT